MEELERILREHAKRYPLMQPTDAVKLIYQNEFGGGHLIQNEQACLNYLRREYADLEKDPTVPLYEDIGNGIIRVNLAAVKPEDLERLGRAFIDSAARHKGSLDSFLNKLKVLETLTEEGVFPFDTNALSVYLSEYKAAGYDLQGEGSIWILLFQSGALVSISTHDLPNTGDAAQGGMFPLPEEFPVGHDNCVTGCVHSLSLLWRTLRRIVAWKNRKNKT